MGDQVTPKYGRWGSPEPHRQQLLPDDDDPYFKKVGGDMSVPDGFSKILLLLAFFLFWLIYALIHGNTGPSPAQKNPSVPLIGKITLLLLAAVLAISFVHFEDSLDWPDFSAPPLFQNLLSSR